MPGCIDMEEMMSLSSKACTGININAVLIRILSRNNIHEVKAGDRFKFCVNVKN
jgi:hypothetical protein